ncbi:MAG: hypothetical protein E7283_01445 [Lachnospiraceae bacterium]|nr:hypothetical protein [Lachnospiraceae bacterium]
MKRQISICIILTTMAIILGMLYMKINNDSSINSPENNTENSTLSTDEKSTDSITSSNEYVNYYFCAKNEDGRVAIYDTKTQTLYMETSIETRFLPEEIQKELKVGIYFKTDEELFDFLESYSS